jgi:hypothetical protein
MKADGTKTGGIPLWRRIVFDNWDSDAGDLKILPHLPANAGSQTEANQGVKGHEFYAAWFRYRREDQHARAYEYEDHFGVFASAV